MQGCRYVVAVSNEMMKELISLHCNLLRIAKNDWKKRMKRLKLDKLKRASSSNWAYYSTAFIAL